MDRKAKAITGILVTIFCAVFFSQAYVHAQKTAVPPSVQKAATIDAGKVTDAGNKLCPVTGEPIDGVSTYVYNGKSYNLCCSMCVGVFAKDPEKYSAIADAEINVKK